MHPVSRVASGSLGGVVQARETMFGPLGMQSGRHASGMACVWRQGAACGGLSPAPTPTGRTVAI